MRTIHVIGDLPQFFPAGFALLGEELGLKLSPDGLPVKLAEGDCLELTMDRGGATLTYDKQVSCWRGLSLLAQHFGKKISLSQKASFPTLGMMIDVSRNAVLRVDTVKLLLRKMAMMGFDLGMLYTEDTYQVEGYPYFGYLRGRYSKEELRELDDYAFTLGIELCPCVQTLAHLNRVLHWPQMAHLKDTEEGLMVGAPETYEFLRTMLREASEPYRSRRIHVGMDEAHGLGLGGYLRRNGYREPYAIMAEHLEQVSQMLRELKLEPIMWSDMYFRLSSPTGGYYDSPAVPREAMERAPKDMGLVYWDYYHHDEETYHRMLTMHEAFGVPVCFAGGIWTWTGPAPDFEKTVATTVPALKQAKAHGVQLVLATAWGDNGAEANLLTALYGMQLFAELDYIGTYDEKEMEERFRWVTGADPQAFRELTQFNQLPGVKNWNLRPVNAAKFLLYQDPLVPMYEKDLEGIDPVHHYGLLSARYSAYVSQAAMPWKELFRFYAQLAWALTVKCRYHAQAGKAIRAGDRQAAAEAALTADSAAEAMNRLRLVWRELWYQTNKVYGFEVIDIRVGGVAARMESAASLLRAFAQGRVDTIASLAEEPLPYTRMEDGALRGSYAWGEIASACKVDL